MLLNLFKRLLNIQHRVNLCFLFDHIFLVDFFFKQNHLGSKLFISGQPMTPVRLLYPISRYTYMTSLKHILRFVIHRQIRRDRIDELDLPIRLKNFLKQPQIYTENLPFAEI